MKKTEKKKQNTKTTFGNFEGELTGRVLLETGKELKGGIAVEIRGEILEGIQRRIVGWIDKSQHYCPTSTDSRRPSSVSEYKF